MVVEIVAVAVGLVAPALMPMIARLAKGVSLALVAFVSRIPIAVVVKPAMPIRFNVNNVIFVCLFPLRKCIS